MKGRYIGGTVLQELADAWDAYLDDDAEDFDRLAQAVWGVLGREAAASFIAPPTTRVESFRVQRRCALCADDVGENRLTAEAHASTHAGVVVVEQMGQWFVALAKLQMRARQAPK